jgi:HK97 family phage major capsid protein
MKITNSREYDNALKRYYELMSAQGFITSAHIAEQKQLASAIDEWSQSEQAKSQGRPVGTSGALSDERIEKPKPAESNRLRFRDVVSGREIVALNNNERISDSRLRNDFAGDWLCSAITNNEERMRTLSDELQDTVGDDAPQSAMSGNVFNAGGVFIPDRISNQFLDLARAASVCQRAGARTVAMDSGTLTIARLLSDPVASWRGEGAHIDPSSASFGAYKVITKFLACIVPLTIELIEDAPNASTIVQNAIAAAMGLQLDLFGLRGNASGAGPTGIKNTTDVNTLDFYSLTSTGDNFYKPVSRGIRQILDANYPGDVSNLAWIMAPTTMEDFDSLRDTTKQPLMAPEMVGKLQRFATTSIPTNLVGPSSENYIGAFEELAFFLRRGITFEIVRGGTVVNSTANTTENLISEFKVAIRASMRVDIVCLRPSWFSYLSNVRFA